MYARIRDTYSYAYIYIHVLIFIYIHMYTYTYVHTHIYTCAYMCVLYMHTFYVFYICASLYIYALAGVNTATLEGAEHVLHILWRIVKISSEKQRKKHFLKLH